MLNRPAVLLLIFLCLCPAACTNRGSEKKGKDQFPSDGYLLNLTPKDIRAPIVETGRIQKYPFSLSVDCYGSVAVDPKKHAVVSAPLHGFVQDILVRTDDYVRAGQSLAILKHPDYIRLQLEYLEAKSQYEYYKEDFKRQGVLTLEQATSLKVMQQSQNKFRKIEARLKALQYQLSFLGIPADSFSVDQLQPDISLVAPINGYISRIDASVGMFCPEEKPLFFLSGKGSALLNLNVAPSYAAEIQPGRQIMLSFPHNSIKYYANILSVGQPDKVFDFLKLTAQILGNEYIPVSDAFEHATLIIPVDTAYALPSSAIVTIDKQNYVFLCIDSLSYKLIKVETGKRMNEMTEIRSFSAELTNVEIVTEGAACLSDILMNRK
jgi:hypothetical protein